MWTLQAEEFYQDDVTYILLPDNESLSASSYERNLKGNMKGEMQALLKAGCTSCSTPWHSRFCNYLHPWVIQMIIPENIFEKKHCTDWGYCIYVFDNICEFISSYIHKNVTTITEEWSHEFEREKDGTKRRFWRQERE